jgi:Fe-S-cluster containining protein
MIDAKAARDIAGHLGLTPTQVETFYLKYEGRGLYSVKNSPGNTGTCLFYSGQRCLVDPVKPPICRAWPFLYGTLNSREAFQDAKSTCAGLKDMSYEDFVEDFQSRGLAMPPRTFTSLIQQQSSARLVEAHRFR